MPVNFNNHCGDSIRCVDCTIPDLQKPGDRLLTGDIVRAVLNDPANTELAEGDVNYLYDAVEQKALSFRGGHLVGPAIGAVAVSVTGRCVPF